MVPTIGRKLHVWACGGTGVHVPPIRPYYPLNGAEAGVFFGGLSQGSRLAGDIDVAQTAINSTWSVLNLALFIHTTRCRAVPPGHRHAFLASKPPRVWSLAGRRARDLPLLSFGHTRKTIQSPSFPLSDTSRDKPALMWQVLNVCALDYPDESFNAVVDKGTLDSVLCGEGSTANVAKMCMEISRVLKPNGVYFICSYGVPDNRLQVLENLMAGGPILPR